MCLAAVLLVACLLVLVCWFAVLLVVAFVLHEVACLPSPGVLMYELLLVPDALQWCRDGVVVMVGICVLVFRVAAVECWFGCLAPVSAAEFVFRGELVMRRVGKG